MVINYKKIGIFVIYCLCLFALVRPAYLMTLGGFKQIYTLAMMAAMAYCLVMFFYAHRKRAYNITLLLLCLFLAIPVLISILKGVSYSPVYYSTQLSLIALVMLLGIGFRDHYEQMLQALSVVLALYVYVNFLSILLNPVTLYSTETYRHSNWFLGYKNVMVRTMLPALAANAVYSVHKKGHLSLQCIVLYVCCILTELIADSKTGFLGVLIFGIIVYFFREGDMPRYVNLKSIGVLILLISLAMTAFDLVSMFSGLITDLGEESSMLNRFRIWEESIALIWKHPIVGYGYRSTEGMRQLLRIDIGWTDVSHPHNYFLYILLQGGVLLFALGVWIYGRVGQLCLKNRGDFTSKVILALYVSFLAMGLVESLVGTTLLYPMMMLGETTRYRKVIYKKRQLFYKIKFKKRK